MDFAQAVRSTLLVVLAAFNLAVLVPATFFAIYIAFGAREGWREAPDPGQLAFVAIVVAAPLLLLAGPTIAWVMRKRWSFIARLFCLIVPLAYYCVWLQWPW